MKLLNKTLVLALFSVVLGFTTGCGNMRPNGLAQVQSGAYQFDNSSNNDDWAVEAKFTCAGHPFIVPNQDTDYSDTEHFTACPSNQYTNLGDILVKGYSNESRSICVIPAKQDSAGNISWYRDSRTGQPIYVCSNLNPTKGTIFSFPSLTQSSGFNAAYIVEETDMSQMVQYLAYRNVTAPNYSFGEFR